MGTTTEMDAFGCDLEELLDLPQRPADLDLFDRFVLIVNTLARRLNKPVVYD